MGWWGSGVFDGDSPSDDRDSYLPKSLVRHIRRVIKSSHCYDKENIPALIFIYADYFRRFAKKIPDQDLIQYLKDYKVEGWKDPNKRKKYINELVQWIEDTFEFDSNKTYRTDSEEQANIVGKEVYHLTKEEHLKSICKDGLKANKPECGFITNKVGVYVSTSILGALKWQFYVLGYTYLTKPAFVKFEIQKEDIVFQDTRVCFKDDFIIANDISPQRLVTFS